MSVPRSEGLEILRENKQPILMHLIKICIYQNSTNNLDHWIHELASFAVRINNVMLKPNNRKFSAHIYQKEIFSRLGDTETDIDSLLGIFWANNLESNRYPDFEITDDMIASAYLFMHALADRFVSIWATKNTLSAAAFKVEIRRLVHQYYNM